MISKGIYRNKKLLQLAEHSPCQWCQLPEGTGRVVACHVQSFRAQNFGKGTGIKPSDACTAFLCNDCHDLMDRRTSNPAMDSMSPIEHAELWSYLILKTHEWIFTHHPEVLR
ncbi:hypothetical protein [Endozoicomonas sp. ALB091]|uniref:hypothetical protein n=1 Tax=Endozoicomonas sp. ALB091 TaxID=3403073 RepID=UPI003BB5BBFA